MKLLTTSSADIVQECRVMFDAKSVSKSIFKCRRNVLRVVFDFKMANIRGIKSGALSCRLMHSCSAMDRHMQHAVFHTIAFLAFSCLAFSVAPRKPGKYFLSRCPVRLGGGFPGPQCR